VSARPDPFLDYDAAYVIGALDPQDRRAFEKHLAGCARCTAAVTELAGMPGLLAQVPTEQMLVPKTAPDAPPETLLPRLAATIRRQRLRRWAVSGLVGAVAAACLVTGIVLTARDVTSGEPRPPQGIALAMTAVVSSPLTATVRMDQVSWGTRLNLECTYGEAESPRATRWGAQTYRLVLVPKDGSATQQVAQWKALPGRTVTLPGSTDLTMAQIKDIRLLDGGGATLMHVAPTV
jgi:hypothetical protein